MLVRLLLASKCIYSSSLNEFHGFSGGHVIPPKLRLFTLGVNDSSVQSPNIIMLVI